MSFLNFKGWREQRDELVGMEEGVYKELDVLSKAVFKELTAKERFIIDLKACKTKKELMQLADDEEKRIEEIKQEVEARVLSKILNVPLSE